MNIKKIIPEIIIFTTILLPFNSALADKKMDKPYISNYIIRDNCNDKNINYINDFMNIDDNLDGDYISSIKTKETKYTLSINFENNYFKSINLYDINKSVGYSGLERQHILNISCHDLYSDNSKCYKDFILNKNNDNNKIIKQFCSNKLHNKSIPKSFYFDDILGKYLFINGFNTSFIKDIFDYKDKINHGVPDI